ncbi:NAD-dependent epimerase/dehydratase family protein [Streptomyces netropsis]|uniref:UDP-glucose 4-epimerase n=1 Tax=Streptomyces netropsis TaxID=55404 RepID=A0A7W7LB19_STRNE|nr:NAD-dependent epimerase/dehydratase family protein [Streptomyces netropsis]MBB4886376.1 UDP-glucose 4-epimerase [Streptomyces netropsis]
MPAALVPNGGPRRPEPVVAVVGANGFLGRSVMRALSGAGVEARGFTSAEPAVHGTWQDPALRHCDVVFYLASRISPAIAEREPERAAQEITDFRAFLDALRENPRRPVVTLAASGGTVYDPRCEPPYDEQSPARPSNVYGKAKLEQEEALAGASDWLAPVVLRLSNVYGPGQRTAAGYGVIGHWMQALLAGEQLRILGHGGSSRDYVHVDDVANAMLAVLGRAPALRAADRPTVLNIGAGSPTSLDDLHRHLEATVGRPVPVEREPARPFDRRDVWLDIRRAADVLGWRPEIGLAEGLADTWKYQLSTSREPARPAHRPDGR